MRPKKARHTCCRPGARIYKPRGTALRGMDLVQLEADEVEALFLADGEDLHHAEGGKRMGVSRATFGRILKGARSKVADALIHGKAIQLAGDESSGE